MLPKETPKSSVITPTPENKENIMTVESTASVAVAPVPPALVTPTVAHVEIKNSLSASEK